MNDIIKLILLNFILFYFLIKKNKSLSIFLIVVLFIYLLYLRGGKLLEGQDSIKEKKDEVKFMKMVNLDRLLGKLLNVYEHSEEDCIGGYTDFTPCDKKCGITHKYKTYRVKRKAGLFGKSCVEEDGRRKKELCDESDGVYKCIIGESCQEDSDCDSDNCDPRTDRCVPEKVCSNTNLDLCNKEECIDLNNHYDYTGREFKYDETESGIKCKLEDKDTDTEEENEEEDDIAEGGLDPSIIAAVDCETNELYWYLEPQDRDLERVTSAGCKLKIPNSVFYENEDSEGFQERKIKYGVPDMESGLYCKMGNKFGGDNPYKGVTERIEPGDLNDINEDDLDNMCKTPFTIDLYSNDDGTCKTGYWPPLNYFKNRINLDNDFEIPIEEMCTRCDNGTKYDSDNPNYDPDDPCQSCGGELINQFNLDSQGNYTNLSENLPIGMNTECTEPVNTNLTCSNFRETFSMDCNNDNKINNNDNNDTSIENFYNDCCEYCPLGQKFSTDQLECISCPAGEQGDSDGTGCVSCPPGTYREESSDGGCQICVHIPRIDRTKCDPNTCGIYDINNGDCDKDTALYLTFEMQDEVTLEQVTRSQGLTSGLGISETEREAAVERDGEIKNVTQEYINYVYTRTYQDIRYYNLNLPPSHGQFRGVLAYPDQPESVHYCRPKPGKRFRRRDGSQLGIQEAVEFSKCGTTDMIGDGEPTPNPLGDDEIDFYDECCKAVCPMVDEDQWTRQNGVCKPSDSR